MDRAFVPEATNLAGLGGFHKVFDRWQLAQDFDEALGAFTYGQLRSLVIGQAFGQAA